MNEYQAARLIYDVRQALDDEVILEAGIFEAVGCAAVSNVKEFDGPVSIHDPHEEVPTLLGWSQWFQRMGPYLIAMTPMVLDAVWEWDGTAWRTRCVDHPAFLELLMERTALLRLSSRVKTFPA